MTIWLVVMGGQLLMGIGLAAIGWYVVRPYFILRRKQREALAHRPQPEELWVHNKELFYIDYVNDLGVGIIKIDAKTKQPYKWREPWPEWHARLVTQTLFWTGMKGPLGPQ